MYTRTKIGSRMEPRGTPDRGTSAHKDLIPSSVSCLKEMILSNLPVLPYAFSLMRSLSCNNWLAECQWLLHFPFQFLILISVFVQANPPTHYSTYLPHPFVYTGVLLFYDTHLYMHIKTVFLSKDIEYNPYIFFHISLFNVTIDHHVNMITVTVCPP